MAWEKSTGEAACGASQNGKYLRLLKEFPSVISVFPAYAERYAHERNL
jgi:hypothetical protein